MRIKWNDLQIGDEIIIPSNSNLKYLKVLTRNKKSFSCSFQKGVTNPDYKYKDDTLQADVSKHNATFHLKDERGYRDIWLVKRTFYK